MWQDEHKKKNFVAVTVHMLERDRMVTRVLTVNQWPFDTQVRSEHSTITAQNG